MSEVEGNWGSGYNSANMEPGLGIADRIIDDLRELEPSAWVFWQPVEDLYNMEPQGENLNWGSIFLDFDCKPYQEAVPRSGSLLAGSPTREATPPRCPSAASRPTRSSTRSATSRSSSTRATT